jgi:hypothetical protein
MESDIFEGKMNMKKVIGYILAFSPVWVAFLALAIISLRLALTIFGIVFITVTLVLVGCCLIADDWPWSK